MIITLTGRISSGKDSVLSFLKIPDCYKIIDADKLGHELLDSSKIKETLLNNFGDDLLSKDKKINRKLLSLRIFPNKITEFNKIIHPQLTIKIKDQLSHNCLINAALLTELKLKEISDLVILVDRSDENIIKTSTHPAIKEILSIQKSRDWYLKQADIIIDNNSSLIDLKNEVEKKCKNLF